jgi:hypothetical protein
VEAVADNDRQCFATQYLTKLLLVAENNNNSVQQEQQDGLVLEQLDIPLGEGDTRPLIRHLRMVAYWAKRLLRATEPTTTTTTATAVSVRHRCSDTTTTGGFIEIGCCCDKEDEFVPLVSLTRGPFETLLPQGSHAQHNCSDSTLAIISGLRDHHLAPPPPHLGYILDYFFAGALTPAVVISRQGGIVSAIMDQLEEHTLVRTIRGIDPTVCKMSRSLYDPKDLPNLRDSILALKASSSLVAVEITAHSTASQLCIRELVEDTPSRTAFSTQRSALRKDGLLFCIHVSGELTPELESRASVVV